MLESLNKQLRARRLINQRAPIAVPKSRGSAAPALTRSAREQRHQRQRLVDDLGPADPHRVDAVRSQRRIAAPVSLKRRAASVVRVAVNLYDHAWSCQ